MNLFRNRVIAKIAIFAHQIVEITHLIIDLIVPSIAGIVVEDLNNTVFVGIFDVINAAETVVVPNKVGILTRAGREGVACSAFAFNDIVIDLRAVILTYALNANTFFFVRAHFVVHDYIEQHRNVIFFERVDRRRDNTSGCTAITWGFSSSALQKSFSRPLEYGGIFMRDGKIL